MLKIEEQNYIGLPGWKFYLFPGASSHLLTV